MIGKARGCLLNSKEEYTRCMIPELSTTHSQPTKSTPTSEIDNQMKRSRDSTFPKSRKRPRKETDTEIMPPPPSRQAPSKSNKGAQRNPLTIKEMIQRMKMNPTPHPELPEPARDQAPPQEPQVEAGTKVQEPSPNPEPPELLEPAQAPQVEAGTKMKEPPQEPQVEAGTKVQEPSPNPEPPELPEPASDQEPPQESQLEAGTKVQEPSPNPEPPELPQNIVEKVMEADHHTPQLEAGANPEPPELPQSTEVDHSPQPEVDAKSKEHPEPPQAQVPAQAPRTSPSSQEPTQEPNHIMEPPELPQDTTEKAVEADHSPQVEEGAKLEHPEPPRTQVPALAPKEHPSIQEPTQEPNPSLEPPELPQSTMEKMMETDHSPRCWTSPSSRLSTRFRASGWLGVCSLLRMEGVDILG